MTDKTGRNEPCPCGSGKKYKNCCIEKDAAMAAIKGMIPSDDELREYNKFAEKWDPVKGPVPSYMQFKGRPNTATSAMTGLQAKMAEMEFKSVDELNEFIKKEIDAANMTPRDEFLGLTSAQVYSLTRNCFQDNLQLVELSPLVESALVENLPVIRQCRFLLERLAENEKGIKGTVRGNFPRKLAQDFYELFVKENDYDNHPPSKEEDVDELIKLRFFLSHNGLMKKQHDWFSLTKKGHLMSGKGGAFELYRMLFLYFSDSFDWLGGTRYPDEFGYLQNSLVFCLYMLKKTAAEYKSATELADVYRRAFPEMVKAVEEGMKYPIFDSGFMYMFLERYAVYLGLAEMKGDRWKFDRDTLFFKTTSLFRQVLTWKI